MLGQVADEGARLGHRPADDAADVRRQIQRLAAGDRVRDHQPMLHRTQPVLVAGRVVGEADLLARKDDGVFADQVFDLGLGRVVQRVVGGAHVGEFGVAALAGMTRPCSSV